MANDKNGTRQEWEALLKAARYVVDQMGRIEPARLTCFQAESLGDLRLAAEALPK